MTSRALTILMRVMLASVTALYVATAAVAQSAAVAATKSPFAGTWEGEMNGLPGVTLIVADAGGGIVGGVVTFYFQMRGEDEKWRIAGKYASPLLAVHPDGKVLTFEVQHHKTHNSPEFGPNARFRMELTKTNEATLENLDEGSPGPMKIRRRD